ncbi:copper chaperone PCu(A)C [Streptomyces sp. 549]|uniref:copper chaperone PCu(A)C n=1 Tax=Streptomyces sp. 549 TaxID=3049076 RepID=UPI0024C46C4E|nr:copper chaperone PCu(A)C [Streptomyces sp. 549]MDK1474979.1 copper chaperone PCu(A)C [Streptomyces sp. 549]
MTARHVPPSRHVLPSPHVSPSRNVGPSRRLRPVAALAVAAALALGGCAASPEADGGQDGGRDAGQSASKRSGPAPQVKPGTAYVPEPVTSKMAGGFLVLVNAGDEDDRLVSVTSDLSDDVQLHRTVDNRMEQVDSMKVPAGGELALTRGGNHLMFMGLTRTPAEGDRVSLELRFEKSDPITLDVPVEAKNHAPHSHS